VIQPRRGLIIQPVEAPLEASASLDQALGQGLEYTFK